MGPGDSYILQYSRSIESFWATPYSLALGTRFRAPGDRSFAPPPRQLLTQAGRMHDQSTHLALSEHLKICISVEHRDLDEFLQARCSPSGCSGIAGCCLQDAFERDVKEGFQASATWHQGAVAFCMPGHRLHHPPAGITPTPSVPAAALQPL